MNEIARRLSELVSLLSCLLNIIVGTGDREATLSAGSWELRRRGSRRGRVLVAVIDAVRGGLGGRADHCEQAWTDHGPVWAKVEADRAGAAK
jgi:hypothetical protein